MTDLEILIKFRKAEATGHINKLTKAIHDCEDEYCDACPAQLACRELVDCNTARDFYYGYKDWAERTPFLSLSELQQHYPEYFL